MTRNIRMLIGVALAAGAGFGFWHFVLAPKRLEAAKLATQAQTAQAQIAQEQATLGSYRKAQADYKANYMTVVRLGKAVPADDDTRSMVVQLNAAALRSGVDFSALQLSGAGASASTSSATGGATTTQKLPPGAVQVGSALFAKLPFSFGFSGDFDGLTNFFGRLERFVSLKGDTIQVNGRLLRVETLDIVPGEGGFPNLKATIGASSYLAPAQDGLTTSAAAAAGTAGTAASATASAASSPASSADSTTSTSPTTSTGATG